MEMHMTELILLSLIFLFLPMSVLAEDGIASKYHKDQGIADDPAVVFSEDFEKPLSDIFANWNGRPPQGQSKDDYLTAFFQNFMTGYAQENTLDGFWFKQLPLFLKHHQILLFTVFTDEWKTPNPWQSDTLRKWKRQILKDTPVVRMQF